MPRGSAKGERRGGRQRGTPNKLTLQCRAAIEHAAQALGGAERLAKWAKASADNEAAFWCRIYPRLLPLGSEAGARVNISNLDAPDAEDVGIQVSFVPSSHRDDP